VNPAAEHGTKIAQYIPLLLDDIRFVPAPCCKGIDAIGSRITHNELQGGGY
jgi:hypothetical protein